MTDPDRPDPDKLLDLVNADRTEGSRGRLKIFFGAAAGVGKTYAMLSEARRLHTDEGRDVLIGVIEHHGRPETLALIDGLPRLPPAAIEHRGVSLREFDLDAALERHPSLILVDELAHTNAPGTRHPKRWLDVKALIDAGIDVMTTLNVQHLESVNDIVARLTGVFVQETVPDLIFDEADEVALVDIPSDDLLQRLAAGKVYIGDGARKRAAEQFFRKPNLTALRELALRRTADRVDAEGDELALGTRGLPVMTRLLVLVEADIQSARLIRRARRMAVAAKAPWTVLYLGTHADETLGHAGRLRLERHLRLAESLGATIERLPSADALSTVLGYARRNGFSRIVVAAKPVPRWLRWARSSLAQQLIEAGAGLEIVVVSDDVPDKPVPEVDDGRPHRQSMLLRGLFAVGVVAACTLICWPFRGVVDANDLTMIYLSGVVVTAARFGIGPSLVASALSVVAFNFFFTAPYWTLRFYDRGYWFTFAFMLVTSLIVGSMTARLNAHARQARQSEEDTRILYAFTRNLASVRDIGSIAEAAANDIGRHYGVTVTLHARGANGLSSFPTEVSVDDVKELGVIEWVIDHGEVAGRHTDTMPSAKGLYMPLKAGAEMLGAIGLTPNQSDRHFSGSDILRFETVAELVAGALQRVRRVEEAEEARLEAESERLRNVLLASVSHDLRTPLTVMNGSVANLLKMRKKLPREAMDELAGLWGQLTRLQRFVGNLLKMAAITSGRLALNFQPYLIQEIIGSAIAEVEERREGRQVNAAVKGTIPLVVMDGALIQQVLVNLIENAIAHTAADGTITVHVEKDADVLRVRVSDNGSGIVAGEEEKIFDKFHRDANRPDQQGSGTGLGLAICRGIVNAHGGIIYAKNNPSKVADKPAGASLIFTLPLEREPAHA